MRDSPPLTALTTLAAPRLFWSSRDRIARRRSRQNHRQRPPRASSCEHSV